MKKLVKRLAALALAGLMLLLGGCHSLVDDALDTKYVSATFYPLYVLAANVMQGVPALSLSCLTQPQDGCLRSYALSDWDYATLMRQDAVILAGRGLESFEAELNQLPNQPILLGALEGQNLRAEDAGDADDDRSHFTGENPWRFLSVAGAMEMSMAIAGGMQMVDEAYAGLYAANLQAYLERLETLIREMSDVMACAPACPVAVLHEGLPYFAEQFGLDMALIYPREPGSDLVDNDLQALLTALEESGARVVFLESQAPMHLTQALEEAGYAVARLDTLTAHTADGELDTYERVMRENARVACAALENAR